MSGEENLSKLVQGMSPKLNPGEYVFVTVNNLDTIKRSDTLCEFKEQEGTTLILERTKADSLGLTYPFIASWITLQIQSSLEAVGFTALFSKELTKSNISCNVIAAYYHDHIFVNTKDSVKAMQVLTDLAKNYK